MRCINYCGVTCVNGGCPNALANSYPEYGYEHVTCKECGYYRGCEDCAFYNTEVCAPVNEKGELWKLKVLKLNM